MSEHDRSSAKRHEEFEDKCCELSCEAAEWIVGKLVGTHGTGWRETDDLENEIYGWLIDHAIFE